MRKKKKVVIGLNVVPFCDNLLTFGSVCQQLLAELADVDDPPCPWPELSDCHDDDDEAASLYPQQLGQLRWRRLLQQLPVTSSPARTVLAPL